MKRGALLGLLLAACGPAAAPAPCTLAGSGDTARVFAVTHRVRLDDAENLATFAASFRRHADAVAGCGAAAKPTVLLFPEDSGLAAWFVGRRGLLGRNASDSAAALTALYAQTYPAADAYRRRYPGISDTRALTLGLSDRAWRAMDRTFGGLAKEANAWVVASAHLPYSEARDDDLFRDPDATGPAYVATSPEVFNSALVYAPTGDRVGRVDKVFLSGHEEQTLALSAAPLEAVGTVDLPFVKLGIASSGDAFAPPFVQRLDDLGAELVVQPQASAGWVTEEVAGDWLPDRMLGSGWSATQKYTSVRHAAAPMLTGNVFELAFDGQAFITRKAEPGQALRAFVASAPVPGFEAIGPWAFPEPDPGASLAARRTAARERGADLLPGSKDGDEGNTNDSVIGADLHFDGEATPKAKTAAATLSLAVAPAARGHQRNPAVAFGQNGDFYAVWSDTRDGAPRIWVTRSEDDGATWAFAHAVDPDPGTSRQLRPTIAAGDHGLVVVAWQDDARGSDQIRWAVSRDGARTFVAAWAERSARAQWEPAAVALGGDGWALAWSDFRDGAWPQVRARCFAINQVTGPSRPIDPAGPAQLQPTLVGTTRDTLFAAWVDHRHRDWQVRTRAGALCDADGASLELTAESPTEVLAADPQGARAPDGRVMFAWDELRDRRGHREVAAAEFGRGVWQLLPPPVRAEVSRFRPSPYWKGGFTTVVQDLAPGKNTLSRWTPGGAEPARFDDTADAPDQLTRPRAAARGDSTAAVIVFEDDRDGWVRVRSLRR